jgi:hypothetical protein
MSYELFIHANNLQQFQKKVSWHSHFNDWVFSYAQDILHQRGASVNRLMVICGKHRVGKKNRSRGIGATAFLKPLQN